MLLYGKKAQPKAPKRRSRTGCIHCKEKKKKCNEQQPRCDRCIERNLICEYEAIKPRKRRRTSLAVSQSTNTPRWDTEHWIRQYPNAHEQENIFYDTEDIEHWDTASSHAYTTGDSFSEFCSHDDTSGDANVEEIPRNYSASNTAIATSLAPVSRSSYMDLAMIAPSPVTSPLFEFSAPVFQEFSNQHNRRALVDHFCNVMSHLIVFKEDTGNPFRQLVLPLSHASSPVMNAIFALSSAHLEYRGIENEEKSLDFHNRALQGLAEMIDLNDVNNREEVLGAIMLLVYYEVLVQRGSSNIVHGHLKGALTIMKNTPAAPTPTSQFLERAFRFYDVISALSWGTSPISNTPPTLSPFTPSTLPMEAPNAFSSVDTLLGMATDLWPVIHRLSNLPEARMDLEDAEARGNTSKASVLRTELESTSQAIELALMNWSPALPIVQELDENDEAEQDLASDSRMQSILNNAEAYRQAAFVYLYRHVRGCARRSEKVQAHVMLTLEACIRVVEWGGPMSALLWPLFIGASEAVEATDRELARTAFGSTERRQGMTNIMRAWEVVEEVWKNDDLGIEVFWRDICTEKGYNIVLG